MDSETVVFGKWDNHGNVMNLRLSAQDSQKVGTEVELKFKHGNKHILTVDDVDSLKKAIRYTLMRDVEGFDLEVAHEAVELFNRYHDLNMDPDRALIAWDLKKEFKS